MATLTLVLILIGFLLVLSYIKNLDEEIRDLKKFVGTLDRPSCNFIKGYKKKNHFKDDIETR
jgi:hypothetical protein